MTTRVRILRNRVGLRSALFRLLNVFLVMGRIYDRHTRAAAHDYLTEIRAQKIRGDMELAEMRKRHIMNQLVLDDQKIEENNRRLGHRPGDGIENDMP